MKMLPGKSLKCGPYTGRPMYAEEPSFVVHKGGTATVLPGSDVSKFPLTAVSAPWTVEAPVEAPGVWGSSSWQMTIDDSQQPWNASLEKAKLAAWLMRQRCVNNWRCWVRNTSCTSCSIQQVPSRASCYQVLQSMIERHQTSGTTRTISKCGMMRLLHVNYVNLCEVDLLIPFTTTANPKHPQTSGATWSNIRAKSHKPRCGHCSWNQQDASGFLASFDVWLSRVSRDRSCVFLPSYSLTVLTFCLNCQVTQVCALTLNQTYSELQDGLEIHHWFIETRPSK